MSAEDNELDYLHVPRNSVDAALMELHKIIDNTLLPIGTERVFRAVAKALREIDRDKRERW